MNDRPKRSMSNDRSRTHRNANHNNRSFSREKTNRPSDVSDNKEDDRPRLDGAARALMELDLDLMKILVRRAKLVSRVRGGKEYASTPFAIQSEKAVRQSWESNAIMFSKDPRFSRQLFSLLQELNVMSREDVPAENYNIAPSQKPISGTLNGPSSVSTAQMWIAIASMLGKSLDINNALMTEPLADCVKIFTQAGVNIESPSEKLLSTGLIKVTAGNPCSFVGKTVYVGNSTLCLYLIVFLTASTSGTCRMTGGVSLKEANFSALRKMLPLLGARLAHVVPHSVGLPAHIECSGVLPEELIVPEDLPFEGVCALLLAPLIWNIPFVINLEKLPASVATTALATVEGIHLLSGAKVRTDGSLVRYTPRDLSLPSSVSIPLDPILSSYLFAVVAFTDGNLTLTGKWETNSPEAIAALELLKWGGLSVQIDDDSISVSRSGKPCESFLSLVVPSAFSPLVFAFAALAVKDKKSVFLPDSLIFEEDSDVELAKELFERIGRKIEERTIAISDESINELAWTSPNAFWSMGYACCSFLKQGLKLTNPYSVSTVFPLFWSFYNNLPDPAGALTRKQKKLELENDPKSARRRIIAE